MLVGLGPLPPAQYAFNVRNFGMVGLYLGVAESVLALSVVVALVADLEEPVGRWYSHCAQVDLLVV